MLKHTVVEYLSNALNYYSKKEIANELEVNVTTLNRWLKKEVEPKSYAIDRLKKLLKKCTNESNKSGDFKFIDLFAGIGGIRKAFENEGGECVFTSEWDSFAQKTYATNYRDRELLNGDITEVLPEDIPEHDVLLAGFPCQPFSIAGVSKKASLGRAHGFDDETQGTLFFNVVEILKAKQPKAFVLENVKNLKSHDKGHTFAVIMDRLENVLDYNVEVKIIDGQHWVPQHRERIVIVGFRRDLEIDFDFNLLNLPPKGSVVLGEILHKTDGSEPYLPHDEDRFFDFESNKVLSKYTLSDKLWEYLQNYAAKHKAKGNGFGFGLVDETKVTRTLSARYYKDGSEILVHQEGKNPRRLTPRECARLMGFDDSFVIPVSDTRAYKQFGNSVVVPVFQEVARIMKPFIMKLKSKELEQIVV